MKNLGQIVQGFLLQFVILYIFDFALQADDDDDFGFIELT